MSALIALILISILSFSLLTVFGVSKALGSVCQSRGLPQVAPASRWRLHFLLVCFSLGSSHGSGVRIKRESKGGVRTPPDKNWRHTCTPWSLSGVPTGERQWAFCFLPALECSVSIVKECSRSDLPRQRPEFNYFQSDLPILVVLPGIHSICGEVMQPTNNIRASNSRNDHHNQQHSHLVTSGENCGLNFSKMICYTLLKTTICTLIG